MVAPADLRKETFLHSSASHALARLGTDAGSGAAHIAGPAAFAFAAVGTVAAGMDNSSSWWNLHWLAYFP